MSTEISGSNLANLNVVPNSGESLIPRITPEELCRLKSSEFTPPSPNLRFSVQVPMYNETPLHLNKFEDMGHLVRQLHSIASAALVSGTPDEVELLLNIGNELDDTVISHDGKVFGTQENMEF